jgi:RNA recognition motif-containing protein
MKSKTLVLTNISSSVRKSEISSTFEKYGKIVSLKMKPVETYQATIVFDNQSEAEEAHDKYF